jgi:hypothetical protein
MNPIYELKMANKDSACFICNKFTVYVLRNDSDWFYCCLNHTKDPSFGTEIGTNLAPAAKGDSETPKNDKEKTSEDPKIDDKPSEPASQLPKKLKLNSQILYLRQKHKEQQQKPKRVYNFPSVPK